MISEKDFTSQAYQVLSDKEKKFPNKIEIFVVTQGEQVVNGRHIDCKKFVVNVKAADWGDFVATVKYKNKICPVKFILFGVCCHKVPVIEYPNM